MFLLNLSKDISELKADFHESLVGNVTLTPDQYQGPLREILKHIQIKNRNEEIAIDFVFNNYTISGTLKKDGSLTLKALPEKLDNNMVLLSVLNNIALTLIVKDKTKEYKISNPATTKRKVLQKSLANRMNCANYLLSGKAGKYLYSNDGENILNERQEQLALLVSADYFVKNKREDGATILMPLIVPEGGSLVDEINAAIEIYKPENILSVSLTQSYIRRLPKRSDAVMIGEGMQLKQTQTDVKNETIFRYLRDQAIKSGLTRNTEQDEYIDTSIKEIISSATKESRNERKQIDNFLLYDPKHPLKVSFGRMEVVTDGDTIRTVYTFVNGSARVEDFSSIHQTFSLQ